MSTKHKIMVLIPTYNEKKTIGEVIKGVKENLPLADIVVVDGESTDSTREKARSLGAVVLEVSQSLGIGGGVETGFRFADLRGYDTVIRVDGDAQHNPKEIGKLMEAVLNGRADIAIGSRYVRQGDYKASLPRMLNTKLFSLIVSGIIRQKISDTTSGFQVLSREVVRFFSRNYLFDYSEVEALVLLKKAGFRIVEIPVSMRERGEGQSSFGLIKGFFYVFAGVLSLAVGLLRRTPRRRV